MRSTLQNTGQTVSIAIFFTIVILSLSSSLGPSLAHALAQAGAPQLSPYVQKVPVTGALFAAFLGYDPVKALLGTLPASVASQIPSSAISIMEQRTWFPSAIAPSFMLALRETFYFGAALSFIAAVASALREKLKSRRRLSNMMQRKLDVEVLVRISRVYRAVKREFNRRLESRGLNYIDFLILMTVKESPKSMVYLAKEVLMTQAGITAAIDRLEEKGLVKRERDKEDRRIINVQITESGVRATEEAMQVYEEMASELMRDLGVEEKEKLIALLDILQEKILRQEKMAQQS